jgi:hypothetical protein
MSAGAKEEAGEAGRKKGGEGGTGWRAEEEVGVICYEVVTQVDS